MAYRDFDSEFIVPDASKLQPACEFKLAGRKWATKPKELMPAGLLEVLAGDERGRVRLRTFFNMVLQADQREDFDKEVLSNPDSPLLIDNIRPVFEYVVEQVTERPTTPQPGSPNGRVPVAATSQGGSPSLDIGD